MKRMCWCSIRMFGLMMVLILLSRAPSIGAETYSVGILDFPPFYIVKSENEVEGTMADLLRKIMDKAGMTYVVKGYPPKRLYRNLADGTTQVWMGIKGVPDYDNQVIYSDIPIKEIQIRVYNLAGKPQINSLAELKGKKIITIRGYSYGGMAAFISNPENGITADPSDTHELAFKKLLKGRADYVLDYKSPAEEALSTINISNLEHTVLKSINIYMMVSNKTPDAENVLKKMEDAYRTLQKEGSI